MDFVGCHGRQVNAFDLNAAFEDDEIGVVSSDVLDLDVLVAVRVRNETFDFGQLV